MNKKIEDSLLKGNQPFLTCRKKKHIPMTKTDLLEESVLQAVDVMAEESDDRVTKILADLFKSAVLKKYKEAYHIELPQGKVHRKNVEKTIDFYFADMSVSFRNLPNLSDDEKEKEIKKAKQQLGALKEKVLEFLRSKDVEVI